MPLVKEVLDLFVLRNIKEIVLRTLSNRYDVKVENFLF